VNWRVLETYRKRLDAIAAACLKANPDLLKRGGDRSGTPLDVADRIRLFDVKWLLMTDFYERRSKANIQALDGWWNIKNDSLSAQSDECIGFVYDALQLLRR
jgi:hypothetical protein